VIVVDVERRRQELVRIAEAAEAALARRRGVREITPRPLDVVRHILPACLTCGCSDHDYLDGGAVDLLLADGLPEETFDEVSVWGQMIHPFPPSELAEGLEDAVARR